MQRGKKRCQKFKQIDIETAFQSKAEYRRIGYTSMFVPVTFNLDPMTLIYEGGLDILKM